MHFWALLLFTFEARGGLRMIHIIVICCLGRGVLLTWYSWATSALGPLFCTDWLSAANYRSGSPFYKTFLGELETGEGVFPRASL